VASSESDIHLQALSYLMTTVIHRLHETDPGWWRETLKEIKPEKESLVRGAPGADIADMVLARVISIVEHALAPPQQRGVAMARPPLISQETVLYSFHCGDQDGYGPTAPVVADAAGNLFGTTEYGGSGECSSNGYSG
jgi:hypothetical protein